MYETRQAKMFGFKFYQTVFVRWEKKAGKAKEGKREPILNTMKKHATTFRNTGACCFGMSFLCCCCCTVGQRYLAMADIGMDWRHALDIYESMDPEVINKLFEDVIKLLIDIRKRYDMMILAAKTKSRNAPLSDLRFVEANAMVVSMELAEDTWLEFLMKDVLSCLRNNDNFRYIKVTFDERMLLMKSVPFFVPAMQGVRTPVSLHAKELEYIKSLFARKSS